MGPLLLCTMHGHAGVTSWILRLMFGQRVSFLIVGLLPALGNELRLMLCYWRLQKVEKAPNCSQKCPLIKSACQLVLTSHVGISKKWVTPLRLISGHS